MPSRSREAGIPVDWSDLSVQIDTAVNRQPDLRETDQTVVESHFGGQRERPEMLLDDRQEFSKGGSW